jgi:glutaredoxin 3
MKQVIIYTSEVCPYCVRAKDLLHRKGVSFEEVRVDLDEKKRDQMIEKSQRRTVPQIFIDEKPIGGCDDLYALDRTGQLDQLLKG